VARLGGGQHGGARAMLWTRGGDVVEQEGEVEACSAVFAAQCCGGSTEGMGDVADVWGGDGPAVVGCYSERREGGASSAGNMGERGGGGCCCFIGAMS